MMTMISAAWDLCPELLTIAVVMTIAIVAFFGTITWAIVATKIEASKQSRIARRNYAAMCADEDTWFTGETIAPGATVSLRKR